MTTDDVSPDVVSVGGATKDDVSPDVVSVGGATKDDVSPDVVSVGGATKDDVSPDVVSVGGATKDDVSPDVVSVGGATRDDVSPDVVSVGGATKDDVSPDVVSVDPVVDRAVFPDNPGAAAIDSVSSAGISPPAVVTVKPASEIDPPAETVAVDFEASAPWPMASVSVVVARVGSNPPAVGVCGVLAETSRPVSIANPVIDIVSLFCLGWNGAACCVAIGRTSAEAAIAFPSTDASSV